MRAAGDHLLVKRLTDTLGKVVSMGPGIARVDHGVSAEGLRPGVVVLHMRYAGDEVTIDGEPHLVLRPGEVLLVDVDPARIGGGPPEPADGGVVVRGQA